MADNYDEEGFCRDCSRRICVCPEPTAKVWVVIWHNYKWETFSSVFDSLEKAHTYVRNIGLFPNQYLIQANEVL